MNSPFEAENKRKRKKPLQNVSISDKRTWCKIFTTRLPFLSPLLNEITEKIMLFCKCVNDKESEFSVLTLFSQQSQVSSSLVFQR